MLLIAFTSFSVFMKDLIKKHVNTFMMVTVLATYYHRGLVEFALVSVV